MAKQGGGDKVIVPVDAVETFSMPSALAGLRVGREGATIQAARIEYSRQVIRNGQRAATNIFRKHGIKDGKR